MRDTGVFAHALTGRSQYPATERVDAAGKAATLSD
jgi:hypothetical protein